MYITVKSNGWKNCDNRVAILAMCLVDDDITPCRLLSSMHARKHTHDIVFLFSSSRVCVLSYDRRELFVTHALCIMVGQPSLTFYYVWHVYTLARACKNETRIWQILVLRPIHILWLCRRCADVLSDITRFRVRLYAYICNELYTYIFKLYIYIYIYLLSICYLAVGIIIIWQCITDKFAFFLSHVSDD